MTIKTSGSACLAFCMTDATRDNAAIRLDTIDSSSD